jgi:hypothetical protein
MTPNPDDFGAVDANAVVTDLFNAAETTRRWFMANTKPRSPADWDARGALQDWGQGVVYAFFGTNEKALYVGETGRRIKERSHAVTHPYRSQPWWNEWVALRLAPMTYRTDRLAIELLLILALAPTHNKKPGSRPQVRMCVALEAASKVRLPI